MKAQKDAAAKLEKLKHEHFNQLWRTQAVSEIERLKMCIETFYDSAQQEYAIEAPPAAAAETSTAHGAPRARPTGHQPPSDASQS